MIEEDYPKTVNFSLKNLWYLSDELYPYDDLCPTWPCTIDWLGDGQMSLSWEFVDEFFYEHDLASCLWYEENLL